MHTTKRKILITGATGLVGQYMLKEFSTDCHCLTLARHGEVDYQIDLSRPVSIAFDSDLDTVIHCAGECDVDVDSINTENSRNLLNALESNLPHRFVYISSVAVYGDSTADKTDESSPLNPTSFYGKSKLAAEKMIGEWCRQNNVALTILRPGVIFGNGVKGNVEKMFNAITEGRYYHIRGNKARRSIVMADDVALSARLSDGHNGTYNVCDGFDHTIIELADAMAANTAENKRILYLPENVVRFCAAAGSALPFLSKYIDKKKLKILTASCTQSNNKIVTECGITFFDTINVIARREKNYNYEFDI